jgi:hypothetical protein
MHFCLREYGCHPMIPIIEIYNIAVCVMLDISGLTDIGYFKWLDGQLYAPADFIRLLRGRVPLVLIYWEGM